MCRVLLCYKLINSISQNRAYRVAPISAFLTRKSAALLENEELQKLLDLLEDNLSPPVEDRMINFEDYLKVNFYLEFLY